MGNSRNGTVYVFGLAVALFGMTTGLSLGAEWKAVNAGLTNMDIRSLAIDPALPTNIYAGTRNGLFKSMDGGAGWRSSGLRDTATIHLVIDFANPSILYAGTAPALAEPSCSGGCYCSDPLLFKSMDGGATWSGSISPPEQSCDSIRAVLLDPSDASILYYAAYNPDSYPPLLKSTDRGATWNYLPPWRYPSPGPFGSVEALAINPLAPNILYVAGSGFPNAVGVFRSTDGGMTWSMTGLRDTRVTVLAIDPRNPSILYAGTDEGVFGQGFQGLFKSTDGGTSWFAINHGLSDLIDTRSSISALVIDPDTPSTLYAATSGNGVFKSSDGGASWIRFSDGLSNRNVRALALAPGASGPNILYAGTSGAGVFKIIDDGLITDPFPVSRTFFVPIIVSSPGVGGAIYESELTLANRSTRDATVEFTYTAAFGGGSGQARTTLEAGRQQIAPDAIGYLRQLGIPIPESGSAAAPCESAFMVFPRRMKRPYLSAPLRPLRRAERVWVIPACQWLLWAVTCCTGCDRMLPFAPT